VNKVTSAFLGYPLSVFNKNSTLKEKHANVCFKTTIIKQNIKMILIAGVFSTQALPGFLITTPPSVCVPDVIGELVVWI